MTNAQQTAAIGLASDVTTALAWESFKRGDRIQVTPDQLGRVQQDSEHLKTVIRSYTHSPSFGLSLLKPKQLPLTQEQAEAVIARLIDHAPHFDRLPQLRALEGIKTFDLHFGSDHAEVLLYDYVQEAVFDEIAKLGWFSDIETVQ